MNKVLCFLVLLIQSVSVFAPLEHQIKGVFDFDKMTPVEFNYFVEHNLGLTTRKALFYGLGISLASFGLKKMIKNIKKNNNQFTFATMLGTGISLTTFIVITKLIYQDYRDLRTFLGIYQKK